MELTQNQKDHVRDVLGITLKEQVSAKETDLGTLFGVHDDAGVLWWVLVTGPRPEDISDVQEDGSL